MAAAGAVAWNAVLRQRVARGLIDGVATRGAFVSGPLQVLSGAWSRPGTLSKSTPRCRGRTAGCARRGRAWPSPRHSSGARRKQPIARTSPRPAPRRLRRTSRTQADSPRAGGGTAAPAGRGRRARHRLVRRAAGRDHRRRQAGREVSRQGFHDRRSGGHRVGLPHAPRVGDSPAALRSLQPRGRPVGDWRPFRDLSGAAGRSLHFEQMCERPLKRLVDTHTELLKDLIDLFSGERSVNRFGSDLSLVLFPLPRIPVLVCYWEPEEGWNLAAHFFRRHRDGPPERGVDPQPLRRARRHVREDRPQARLSG